MQLLITLLCILKMKVGNAAANTSVLLLDYLPKSQLGEEVKGMCMLSWGSFRTGWVQVWELPCTFCSGKSRLPPLDQAGLVHIVQWDCEQSERELGSSPFDSVTFW